MSKKIMISLSVFVAMIALSFSSITSHAMGFTPDDDLTLVQPEDDGSDDENDGIYGDVVEMGDRIIVTEGNILIMSDRIVETEYIVAGVSPVDNFDDEALAFSEDARDEMNNGAVENFLPDLDINLPANDTVLALSDDIGEMADRILYTEDEIGTMADRIVTTEYLIADTIDELDFANPDFSASDLNNAPTLGEHTIGQIIETTPSTDTVTEAAPYDSIGETDVLNLSDDIGDMANNILDTEGDIGETSDNIVETENELSDSLVSIWN